MIGFCVLVASFTPPDPSFPSQFALNNTGVMGSPSGEDLNVIPAWDLNLTGSGITVGIVGNGCTFIHRDLFLSQKENYHYNVDNDTADVSPSPSDPDPSFTVKHAGIVIGASNDYCSLGVAFNSEFYCLKMTNTSEPIVATALRRSAEDTPLKYFATPPQCKKFGDAPFSRCVFHRYAEVDKAIIEIESKTVVVTSAGVDALSGGDAAMFAIAGHPRVITVTDTTASGARAWWANRGTSVLVNGPTGGSHLFGSGDSSLPKLPSIGLTEFECDDMSPIGAGAAHVAGVIALMLEANQNLRDRDIQTILALTATKNDPNHESWVKNAAGYEYSDVYGFGRVNAELAVKAAREWTTVGDIRSVPVQLSDVELGITRCGLLNQTFEVTGDFPAIEWVEVHFVYEDVPGLDLLLMSPSGTVARIVQPSYSEKPHERMRFVARNFFGEAPNGNWTLYVARNSVGMPSTISELEVRVFGPVSFNYPKYDRKTGSDSTKPLPKHGSAELVVTRKGETCNSDMTLQIKGPEEHDAYTVSLRNETSNFVYRVATGVEPNQPVTFKIPCLTNLEDFTLYAESRTKGVSISAPFSLINPNTEPQIVSPAAYETIWMHNHTVNVNIQISANWETLSTNSPAQTAEVGLYDLEQNAIVNRVPVLYSNMTSVQLVCAKPLSQALLYVKPLWTPLVTGCDTLIQPIFVLNEDDEEPLKFKVPLSDACPIPPGINEGSFAGPDPKMRMIWIISVSGFAGLFVVIVSVWHFTCRRRSKEPLLDLNSSALLTTNHEE